MGIISAFPGGGASELDVTAYANVGSLPASADEGAIAVITTSALGDVFALADAPASPTQYDVWVVLGSSSLAPIAFTDEVYLYPIAVYQRGVSTWVLKESYVYTGSAWVEITSLVYSYGAEYLAIMDYQVKSGDVTITREAVDIKFVLSYEYSGYRYGAMWSDRTIDLTNVSSIKFTISHTHNGNCGVHNSRGTSFTAATAFSSGTNQVVTVNTSSVSGLYYIGALFKRDAGTQTGYIHKIELVYS